MTDNSSQLDAKTLMETVSFELDTDLRLNPTKLELGKAELLTDALTLPFTDIESRLNQYAIGTSEPEKLMLQKSMKSYLAKLNSNPLIPLSFRLKVLSRFEEELELFDSEMTAAVLNAHKIGVDLVQKAARTQPSYLRILVDMVTNALNLAVKMLRISLENYRAPAVIAVRQAFDLMRLGLAVIPALPADATSERDKLFKAVCNHEFLRMLDFFGKSHAEQKMTWQELQHHIGILKPVYYRKGEPPENTSGNDTYFVTNTARPNDPAHVETKLPQRFLTDAIVIPMDEFIDRMVTAINRVETVLKNPNLQQNDLHTEEALHTTIIGGNAILNTLRSKERKFKRDDYAGTRVILEWNAAKALAEAHSAIVLNNYEYAPSERIGAQAWSVINISQTGVGLERISDVPYEQSVGALIGLNWVPHKNEPMLGMIRWIKEPKPGEQRMGIEFFHHHFKLYKGVMIGGGTEDMAMTRSWPVLVKPGKPTHTAVFPDCRIFRNMTFLLTYDNKSAHFQVVEIINSGPNYTLCKILPAKELANPGKGITFG